MGGWESSNLCRLCLDTPGTLLHRHRCAATRPAEGWPLPPPFARLARSRVGISRQNLLDTQALLVLRVPRPRRNAEGTFRWLFHTQYFELAAGATWYTDGSLFEARWRPIASAGFAIVVIGSCGQHLAFGNGTPPHWIDSSPAAEAWALYITLMYCGLPNCIVTDCEGLLTTTAAGRCAATVGSAPLARVFNLISAVCDHSMHTLVPSGRLVWMPAHVTHSSIRERVRADGRLLSCFDFRGNRLVDLLAKQAAGLFRAGRSTRCMLASAVAAVSHAAALLGVVTHAANNCIVSSLNEEGQPITTVKRDAAAPLFKRDPKRLRLHAPAAPPTPAAEIRVDPAVGMLLFKGDAELLD